MMSRTVSVSNVRMPLSSRSFDRVILNGAGRRMKPFQYTLVSSVVRRSILSARFGGFALVLRRAALLRISRPPVRSRCRFRERTVRAFFYKSIDFLCRHDLEQLAAPKLVQRYHEVPE